jgi:hypothetical protein
VETFNLSVDLILRAKVAETKIEWLCSAVFFKVGRDRDEGRLPWGIEITAKLQTTFFRSDLISKVSKQE